MAVECEHGDPHPMRCALCRRREDRRMHPERFRDVGEVPYLRERPVPRPVNYDAMVDAARRDWEASRG